MAGDRRNFQAGKIVMVAPCLFPPNAREENSAPPSQFRPLGLFPYPSPVEKDHRPKHQIPKTGILGMNKRGRKTKLAQT